MIDLQPWIVENWFGTFCVICWTWVVSQAPITVGGGSLASWSSWEGNNLFLSQWSWNIALCPQHTQMYIY